MLFADSVQNLFYGEVTRALQRKLVSQPLKKAIDIINRVAIGPQNNEPFL